MELFEYIKSQLPQMPNVQIMKDLGASDELVEYVKESPENTNLNVMGSIGENKKLTYTFVWNEHQFPDTTGIKIGDSVTAPLYNEKGYYWNPPFFPTNGTEEARTFIFTSEMAESAENYTIFVELTR